MTNGRARRWRAPLLCALGLALVAVLPLRWALSNKSSSIHQLNPGTVTRLATSAPTPSPAAAAPSSTPGAASGSQAASAPPIQPGTPAATVVLPAPVQLAIPALSVSAPVEPEGVARDGQMAIPEDIHTLGWYKFGRAPGATAGSTVIVGHVDSAVEGLGTFFTLKKIPDRAEVLVTTADHHVHRYRVVSREEYPKTQVPLAAIFARTGQPRLVLATCGGSFDASKRSYEDNIVVTAVPE